MDSTGIKIMLVTLLMSGAVSAPACSVSFPPSYIDLEDEAYSPELDIHFHLCALARHYFPDCVVLTKNSAGTPPAASPPEPTEAEERLFEAGWEALKRNPEERFPAAWRKLLSLPEKERRSRTAQTLYLLGNLQAQENPREAYGWYQKLRAVVNRGLPDPRQLAAGSFRTNYFYAKDPVQRLRYLVLAAAFGSCPDAGTPEVSDGRPWNPCPFRQELWRELCAMIRQNPHRFLRDPLTAEVAVLFRPELIRHVSGPFVCGERLAMRAFQRGAFDDCRKLLAASRSDSPVRLFLEARLARRDGDGGRAAELLRKWLELDRRRKEPQAAERSICFTPAGHSFSSFPEWRGIFWRESCRRDSPSGRGIGEEVRGEVGAMLYRKRLFQEALYSFLLGNAWSDAALVAEEHLDVTGLREFVDAHENNPRLPERMSRKLRHLLARRLMREGRFEEAGRYFPADLRAAWRDFAEQAAAAKDPALSAERRAAANFRLGQIMLRHDIALFGYELSPDFFICDGQYDQYPIKQRMNRSLPRFHYRLREAGYFQQAGELSSEPSFRFLASLAGGLVLRNRTPKLAEPFYHQLVRLQFPPYSLLLDRYRWIPAPPAGWKEEISSCDILNRTAVLRLIARLLAGSNGKDATLP